MTVTAQETVTWMGRKLNLKQAYDRLERHIERRYGLPVMISDVVAPNTGDFDGVSIRVD